MSIFQHASHLFTSKRENIKIAYLGGGYNLIDFACLNSYIRIYWPIHDRYLLTFVNNSFEISILLSLVWEKI